MNELIIEGLTEEDLRLLKVIVSSYPLTVEDYNKVQQVKELDDKLTYILKYFND